VAGAGTVTMAGPGAASTSTSSSGLSVPQDIAAKRSQFELERASFENKMKDEWTEAQIHTYLKAKLEAEMEFFRSYSELNRSTNKQANIVTSTHISITPKVVSIPEPVQKNNNTEAEKAALDFNDDAVAARQVNSVVNKVEPQPQPEPVVTKKPEPVVFKKPDPVVIKKQEFTPNIPDTSIKKSGSHKAPFKPSTSQPSDNTNSPQDVVKIVRGIMNQVYNKMKASFQADGNYDSEYILSVVKDTIVNSTNELPEDPTTPKLKKIMNSVFLSLKNKFTPGDYTGQQILNILKDTIVVTTNDLMKESSDTEPQPSNVQQSQPETQPKPIIHPTKPVTKFGYGLGKPVLPKTTSDPSLAKAFNKSNNTFSPRETSQQPEEPVAKATEPMNKSGNTFTPRNSQQPEAKSVNTPRNVAAGAKAQPAESTPLATSKPKSAGAEEEINTSKSLENMRSEAGSRISQNPKAKEADLTDPEILTTYVRMRDDQDPLSWMILGYNNSVSPDKLVVLQSGNGDFEEFSSFLDVEKPVYMYLNYRFGDTGRPRFIFMSYVPEAFNGLQKARVLGHRNAVEGFIKYYQISWHCLSIEEITEAELNKKLRKAGGADYSAQESNKGNFSSYKKATRDFYEETDKRTAVKPTYSQGPLTVTPCDISGRAMVAPSTEFLKNTSEVFKGTKT
jgi:hypothetical protein